MSWRVVDIAEDGRYLHYDRGHLVVREKECEIGRLHLSDINAVIVHGHQSSASGNLLVKLAQNNIPFVLCDERHVPVSYLTPVTGHHLQAQRVTLQINISQPRRKKLWQGLIRRKIEEQAALLSVENSKSGASLGKLAPAVKSGDPDNMEARAARLYWPRLLGPDFRRDRQTPGLNGHLNYGYTIIRSAMARAVIAQGLVPSIGLHHHNALNDFCLIDDLIEPFRPYVDALVYANRKQWTDNVEQNAKASLAALVTHPVKMDGEETDLFRAMGLFAQSLVGVLQKEKDKLAFPDSYAAQAILQPELPLNRE